MPGSRRGPRGQSASEIVGAAASHEVLAVTAMAGLMPRYSRARFRDYVFAHQRLLAGLRRPRLPRRRSCCSPLVSAKNPSDVSAAAASRRACSLRYDAEVLSSTVSSPRPT